MSLFTPAFSVKEGETASIETQESDGQKIFMDVLVAREKKNTVGLTLIVSRENAAGEKQVISSPYILIPENKKTQIKVSTVQMQEKIDLSVIATQK